MPVNRIDREGISRLLGATALTRLDNKVRGGNNAQKGYRYETLFGAHRIARLLRKLIDHGEDATVEWQGQSFVDDFVVRRDRRTSFKGYQLKNSPGASWTPDIQADFENQEKLSREEGYEDVRLRLVCSDQVATEDLAAGVPAAINGFASAIYFPWDDVLLAVIGDNPWMAEDFAYLSRHVTPDIAEINDVVQILIGAWEILAPTTQVSEIMKRMRRTSPGIIRTLENDTDAGQRLHPTFIELLNGLPQFEYHIERGFLNWSAYGGSTSGTISHDCFSPKFQALQKSIVELKPVSFDEIEGLLQ